MRRPLLLVLLLLGLGAALWWLGPGRSRDGTKRPRTLVLFTIDTLRRDHVGAYGPGGTSLTPRLDALAARGLLFEDARSPVPLTLPGHTTMLAGLPPAVTGVRLNAYGRIAPAATRGFPLLAERLEAAGWRTGAFVSASPLRADYGLDQGFEVYDDEGLDDETGLGYTERPGEETVARALAWLGSVPATAPAFVWVHLFEPHAPYAPQAEHPLPSDRAYAFDVARADAILGRFLDGLDRMGRGEPALLVTSDHGEALDELGERTHGLLLGDAVLRVPFVLAFPGLTPGLRDDPVDLADVAPTLASLAGIGRWETAEAVGGGRDLLESPAPPDRLRVAESLYAHHLHGWAQLSAAVAPDGSTLVDAGLDRLLWLEPAPIGEPQGEPLSAARRPGLGALGEVLRAYRRGERAERISSGGVAGGYGHAARVQPFLPPAENARLPSPYASIARHFALDVEKQRLIQGVPPNLVVRRLETLISQDPGDPELHFWLGRAWQRLAETTPDPTQVEEARRRAAAAYLASWERGRRDAATLVLAAGVDAEGRASEALALLRRLAPQLPPDCQLLILEARLLLDLGLQEDAEAVLRAAEEACRSPRERALLERTRAGETSR